MMQKNLKNDLNHGTWVPIWEHSVRAIQWIQIWQGLDVFQKSFCPSALDECSFSIERANTWKASQMRNPLRHWNLHTFYGWSEDCFQVLSNCQSHRFLSWLDASRFCRSGHFFSNHVTLSESDKDFYLTNWTKMFWVVTHGKSIKQSMVSNLYF